MADINDNKRLMNFFAANELLSAQKLNQALGIASDSIDALKAQIANFATQTQLQEEVTKLDEKMVHKQSSTPQTIDSDLTVNNNLTTNIIKASMFSTDTYGAAMTGHNGVGINNQGHVFLTQLASSASATPATSNIAVKSNLVLDGVSTYETNTNIQNKYQTQSEVNELIRLAKAIKAFDPLATYQTGDTVIDNGVFYVSLVDNNTGNIPVDNETKWKKYSIDFDNYFTKNETTNKFVQIINLSKYSEGHYYRYPLDAPIIANQQVTLTFTFDYIKSNLVVTAGGVVLTPEVDYRIDIPSGGNTLAQSVTFLKPLNIPETGALEFRSLPYGQLIAGGAIDDEHPSPINTYSSTKVEELYEKLTRYVNANTALASSEWLLTKQLITDPNSYIGYNWKSGWIPLASLRLNINDIFPNAAEVIKIKPARQIKFFVGGGCFEGYVFDQGQTQIQLTSTTQYSESAKIIINKETQKVYFDSESDIFVYQIVVYRSRQSGFGSPDNPSGPSVDNIIDDTNVLLDRTWSSIKINQKFDEATANMQQLYNQTVNADNNIINSVNELRTYTNGLASSTLNSAKAYTQTKIEEAKPIITNDVIAQVDANFVSNQELQNAINPITTKLQNMVDTNTNQTIIGTKEFATNITVPYPTRPTHASTKQYVDETIARTKTEVNSQITNNTQALQTQITANTNVTNQIVDSLRRSNLLSFKGTYDANTIYNKNDVIVHNNEWYVSLVDNNTAPLTNKTNWQLITSPINLDLTPYALKTEVQTGLSTKVDITNFDAFKTQNSTDLQAINNNLINKLDSATYLADKDNFAKLNAQNNFTQGMSVNGDVTVGTAGSINNLIVNGNIKVTNTDMTDDTAAVNVAKLKQYSINSAANNTFTGVNDFQNNISLTSNDPDGQWMKILVPTQTTNSQISWMFENNPIARFGIDNDRFVLVSNPILKLKSNVVEIESNEFKFTQPNSTIRLPKWLQHGYGGGRFEIIPDTGTKSLYLFNPAKTLNTLLHIPDPIENEHAANKGYVDRKVVDNSANITASLDTKLDKTTYEQDKQTFAPKNNPTFTGSVIVPDATANNQATNKAYVDNSVQTATNTINTSVDTKVSNLRNEINPLIENNKNQLNTLITQLRNLKPFKVVGNYEPNRAYNTNEAVFKDGNSMYLSLTDNNTAPLTDKTKWAVLDKPVNVDLSNHYTKQETDNKLDTKVDKSVYEAKVNEVLASIATNSTNITTNTNSITQLQTNKLDRNELNTALSNYAPVNNPTFTGTVIVPEGQADNQAINKKQLTDASNALNQTINTKFTEVSTAVNDRLLTSTYTNDKANFAKLNEANTFTKPLTINSDTGNYWCDLVGNTNIDGGFRFKNGADVGAYFGKEGGYLICKSNNWHLKLTTNTGRDIFVEPGTNGKVFMTKPVVFGETINAGWGGRIAKFLPEDNSTKTLQFYETNPTDNRRFKLLVSDPTAPNEVANKKYVDNIQTQNNQSIANLATKQELQDAVGRIQTFDIKGNWTAGTSYNKNQAVTVGNKLFISTINNNTNNPSTNQTGWATLENPVSLDGLARTETVNNQLATKADKSVVDTLNPIVQANQTAIADYQTRITDNTNNINTNTANIQTKLDTATYNNEKNNFAKLNADNTFTGTKQTLNHAEAQHLELKSPDGANIENGDYLRVIGQDASAHFISWWNYRGSTQTKIGYLGVDSSGDDAMQLVALNNRQLKFKSTKIWIGNGGQNASECPTLYLSRNTCFGWGGGRYELIPDQDSKSLHLFNVSKTKQTFLHIPDPTNPEHAANKAYVDNAINARPSSRTMGIVLTRNDITSHNTTFGDGTNLTLVLNDSGWAKIEQAISDVCDIKLTNKNFTAISSNYLIINADRSISIDLSMNQTQYNKLIPNLDDIAITINPR